MAGIVVRSNRALASCEGLASPQTAIEIEGVKFEVDLLRGHKTGFYLDQKHNYAIALCARNRRVLDCFSNAA